MPLFGRNRDKSLEIGINKPKVIHGVTIKRLPFGKYVEALQSLSTLASDIGEKAFPGLDAGQILERLKRCDFAMLWHLLAVVPDTVAGLMESLLDVPKERILDSKNGLMPTQIMDIIVEAWKVNDLTGFSKGAKELGTLIRARPIRGSKIG